LRNRISPSQQSASLVFIPSNVSLAVGGKPGTLRIHKTQGACGDLAEKKKQVFLNPEPGFPRLGS